MNLNPKEIIRWAVIVLFGGFGFYTAACFLWYLAPSFGGSAFETTVHLLALTFELLFSALLVSIAWLVFLRRYRSLFMLFSAIVSLIIFFQLFALPSGFLRGMNDFITPPWGALILILSLLLFFFPFYALKWIYGLFERLASRLFDGQSFDPRNARLATIPESGKSETVSLRNS